MELSKIWRCFGAAAALVVIALSVSLVGEGRQSGEVSSDDHQLEFAAGRVVERYAIVVPWVAAGDGPAYGPEPSAEPPVEPVATAATVEPVRALAFVDIPDVPVLHPDEARELLAAAGAKAEWIEPLIVIGMCESSGGLPYLHPGETGDGGNSLGAWQLWRGWFTAAGEDVARWWDPAVNARVAVYVRQVRGRFGGAGGWSCADRWGIP